MLTEALLHLFPNADPVRDWSVEAGPDGPFIRAWRRPEPQPTPEQIAAAMLPASKAHRIQQINAECRARLFARYGPAEEQVSRSLGIYGDAEKQAMQAGIAATIDASNSASDAVLAAADVAAVEAVTVTWPVI